MTCRRAIAGVVPAVLAITAPAPASPLSDLVTRTAPDSIFTSLATALEPASLEWSDLDLPISPSRTDPFRLPVVDAVLDRPWALGAVMRTLAGAVPAAGPVTSRAADELDTLGGMEEVERDPPRGVSEAVSMVARALADAPPAQRAFVVAITEIACDLRARWPTTDPSLIGAALEYVIGDEESPVEDKDPFELRADEHAAHRAADRFYARAESLDVSFRAYLAAEAITRWEETWAGVRVSGEWIPKRITTEFGEIVVGSHASDAHTGTLFLIVDPGGDDRYRVDDTMAIFDAAGDDVHRAERGGVAAGVGSVSAIFDRAGNDTYHGGDVGLGAGVMGTGVLVDDAGDDLYLGDRFGQGAGFLGIGVLIDRAGHDTYRMSSYGQGYGSVGGIGVLRDVAGGDRYLFAPRYNDVIRHDDRYISFLQGAALGDRPDRSGGIGLLVDDAGNDLYDSDIYGQGTAYWFGIGGLIDRDGHDVYAGYQYAQGAGVHLAAAILADDAGDDVYRARGVCQGVGHDLAFGVLVDRRGNDTFVTDDLGQGAGNANGIGVLIDHSGGDNYVQARSNTLGYGNPRRGSGSVGLFVDGKGSDQYTHRGRDGGVLTSGRVGVGVDHPDPMESEQRWPEDVRVPVDERDFSVDELFVMASTAPPKFADWKAHALDTFEALGETVMPDVVKHLGSPIVRERYGVRDVAVRVGAPSIAHLAAVIDTASAAAARDAVWCMGFVAATEAVAVLEPHLASANDDVVVAVAMALARTARENVEARAAIASEPLVALLASNERSVRRAALFALGSLERPTLARRLTERLDDEFVGVRITAADQLVRLGEDALNLLDERLSRPGHGRRGALGTLGRIDLDHARALLVDIVPASSRWSVPDRVALATALFAQWTRLTAADDDRAGLRTQRQLVAGAIRTLQVDDDWRVRGALPLTDVGVTD